MSSPAPSPATTACPLPAIGESHEEDAQFQDSWNQICLIITFILLIFVFVSGIIRSRIKLGNLKFLSWMPYSLLFSMIPYAYSRVLTKGVGTDLSRIWAVLLLYIYGSVDNFNALSVEDRSQGRVLFFKDLYQSLPLLFALHNLFMHMKTEYELGAVMVMWIPIVLITLLGLLKVVERTIALMYATCESQALRSSPLLNANHHNLHSQDDEDPLQGCKYLVFACATHDNKSNIDDEVTISKIWHCEVESLLCLTKDQSNHLKDACLSFSLFWLLLRRYVGLPLHESSHQKEAWNLVRNGLLVQKGEYERPFRVVEVELVFLYDLFYSKYFCFYQIGIFWLLKHLLFIGSGIWMFVSWHRQKWFDKEKQYFKTDTIFNYDVAMTITWIVSAIVTLLELIQFIIFATSRWVKVMILCSYVRRESWKKNSMADFCIKKAAQIVCRVSLHESVKTWRSELSQYSILRSCSYLQFFPVKLLNAINLGTGLSIPSHGRKVEKSVKLSSKVKRAAILSLQEHGPHLTNGSASLQASELPTLVKEKLITKTKLQTDAHVIIAWHVATTLCKLGVDGDHVLPNSSSSSGDDHIEVATSLSKYCGYLVAFAPELLPGHVAATKATCNLAIEEAKRLIKPIKKWGKIRPDKVREFIGHAGSTTDVEVGNDQGRIVEQGVKLARILMMEIGDPKQRWQVLASFWAEMILYLAPNSTNEMAHVEKLGDGGEFITLLWALLFHAGIVDKNSFINKDL